MTANHEGFDADDYLHPADFLVSGPCSKADRHRWTHDPGEEIVVCMNCGVYYNPWSQNRALVAQVFEQDYLPKLAATPMHECGPWYDCTLCALDGEPVITRLGKKLPTHNPSCLIIQARVRHNGLSVRNAQVKDWLEELRRQ